MVTCPLRVEQIPPAVAGTRQAVMAESSDMAAPQLASGARSRISQFKL